jgi:hypothetical protein
VSETMGKHPPVRMTYTGRFNHKHTYRTGRQGNVWFHGYKCPTCGDHASRPCNPFKGRKVPPPVCDGITYDEMTGRPLKRPARLPEEPSP